VGASDYAGRLLDNPQRWLAGVPRLTMCLFKILKKLIELLVVATGEVNFTRILSLSSFYSMI
jgi:hypothetical protein